MQTTLDHGQDQETMRCNKHYFTPTKTPHKKAMGLLWELVPCNGVLKQHHTQTADYRCERCGQKYFDALRGVI